MPTNETDKILKAMLREFKEIRSELHELNRNMFLLDRSVQFHTVMTCDVNNQGKAEMLETLLDGKTSGYPEGE